MVHYRRPQRLDEAIEMLGEAADKGRVLVGGTDLLVDVRRRPFEPIVLVDIKEVGDLPPAITITDQTVRFGPTATMSNIVANPQLRDAFPALAAAANVVGSVAIRNRATLVGNICNASPACDTAPALLVHSARITIATADGERTMALQDFFVGPGQTHCAFGELVTSIEVPLPAPPFASAFERLTRRRGVDLATVSVAAGVDDGVVSLGLGAVASTPVLVAATEQIDSNDEESVRELVAELTKVASPITDVRATAPYRQAMTEVLAARAVRTASARTAAAQ